MFWMYCCTVFHTKDSCVGCERYISSMCEIFNDILMHAEQEKIIKYTYFFAKLDVKQSLSKHFNVFDGHIFNCFIESSKIL